MLSEIKRIKCDNRCDVLYSSRINLGKTVSENFIRYKLRVVLCDEFYRQSKYPNKENMLVEHLCNKVQSQETTKDKALQFAKEKLGYIPSIIKTL